MLHQNSQQCQCLCQKCVSGFSQTQTCRRDDSWANKQELKTVAHLFLAFQNVNKRRLKLKNEAQIEALSSNHLIHSNALCAEEQSIPGTDAVSDIVALGVNLLSVVLLYVITMYLQILYFIIRSLGELQQGVSQLQAAYETGYDSESFPACPPSCIPDFQLPPGFQVHSYCISQTSLPFSLPASLPRSSLLLPLDPVNSSTLMFVLPKPLSVHSIPQRGLHNCAVTAPALMQTERDRDEDIKVQVELVT